MKDRAYVIAIHPKHYGYWRELASMIYKFFNKKTGLGANVNEVLTQELWNQWLKNSKEEKCMSGLNVTYGQQI